MSASSVRPGSAVPRGPSVDALGESDRVPQFPFDCEKPRFMRDSAYRVRQDRVALRACLEKQLKIGRATAYRISAAMRDEDSAPLPQSYEPSDDACSP